jgi:hypothetical protein
MFPQGSYWQLLIEQNQKSVQKAIDEDVTMSLAGAVIDNTPKMEETKLMSDVIFSFRSDDFAKNKCLTGFKDQAWLEWGLNRAGALVVRGSFSGWVFTNFVLYEHTSFGIPIDEMKKITDNIRLYETGYAHKVEYLSVGCSSSPKITLDEFQAGGNSNKGSLRSEPVKPMVNICGEVIVAGNFVVPPIPSFPEKKMLGINFHAKEGAFFRNTELKPRTTQYCVSIYEACEKFDELPKDKEVPFYCNEKQEALKFIIDHMKTHSLKYNYVIRCLDVVHV